MVIQEISSKKRTQNQLKLNSLCLLLITSLFFLPGCSNNGKIVSADLGEEFTVSIGQSARINREDLVVTFNEVIGDSRCPSNVVCIWAGVASISVTITSHGDTYSMALNQPGLSGNGTAEFLDYTLTFDLEPYPIAGTEVSTDDYSLTLTVSK